MIILHVLNSLMVGGREKIVVDFCNNIDYEKFKVIILTFSNDSNTLANKLNKNVTLIELPFANTKRGQFFDLWFLGFFKFIREINRLKPDVIHHHLYYHHFLYLAICLKISNFNNINFRTVHTSGLFYQSDKIIDRWRLFIEKIATRISKPFLISISNKIYSNNFKNFANWYKGNAKIPNGINLEHFNKDNFKIDFRSINGFREKDIIGIYVSRLDKGKNHELLISTWKNLVAIKADAKLLLVGDGILNDKLTTMVKEENLENNVLFIGYTSHVAEYISIADFGIFPSSFEGFPISLIEKMAMGLPMVVSDIDVFKEVITHNENGKFFSLEDQSSLLFQLLDLINDVHLQKYISYNARKTAVKYDIRTVVAKTVELYVKPMS